jgi:hypothetical protein
MCDILKGVSEVSPNFIYSNYSWNASTRIKNTAHESWL